MQEHEPCTHMVMEGRQPTWRLTEPDGQIGSPSEEHMGVHIDLYTRPLHVHTQQWHVTDPRLCAPQGSSVPPAHLSAPYSSVRRGIMTGEFSSRAHGDNFTILMRAECFLWTGYYAKCFTCIISHNSSNNPGLTIHSFSSWS